MKGQSPEVGNSHDVCTGSVNKEDRANSLSCKRYFFQSLEVSEAKGRVKEVITRYEKSAPRFCNWLEENAEEAMTFLSYPRSHWKKIRTTNAVERLNGIIRCRTRVERLFPNEESCSRLVTAIFAEMHEECVSNKRYIAFE